MNRKWIAPDPITGQPGPTTQTVIETAGAGATIKQIAEITGGHIRTIQLILKNHGTPAKRPAVDRELLPVESIMDLCGQEARELRRRLSWRKGHPNGQPEPLGYSGYPDTKAFVRIYPPELCGTLAQESRWGLTDFERAFCKRGRDLSDIDWSGLVDLKNDSKGRPCGIGYYIRAAINNFYQGLEGAVSLSPDFDIPVDILGQPVTISKPTIVENYDDKNHTAFMDLGVKKSRPIVGWEAIGWARFVLDCEARRQENDKEPDRVFFIQPIPRPATIKPDPDTRILNTDPVRWAGVL